MPRRSPLLSVLLVFVCARLAAAEPLILFDGRSLAGWEGDPKWWRVQDATLTGGSLTEKVPHNYFLATTRSFQNFDLRLRLKLTGIPNTGMINSGVQVRSLRVPNNTEMSGYQVDAGDGWWGKLYDESRRNKVIAVPADLPAVNAAVRPNDWNDYRILAEGPRLRSWINGVPALDYTETDPAIALDGKIAVQIHSGGMALVQVKDVTLVELPPTPGAPTWDQVGHPKPRPPRKAPAPKKTAATTPASGVSVASVPSVPSVPSSSPAPTTPTRDTSYNALGSTPRDPAAELAAFTLPPGYFAELVAAESDGLGKFINVTWDAALRLWSMTALEYPVDGNEQQAASDALFAAGGRDRVVVFDSPYAAPAAPGAAAVTAPPRTFASGLVMPLGIQPYRDGALVQYGADIRFYRDTDADGRADRHEIILTGFGTQDSHLFPHQFLRQPGGRIFVAQGLFNYSSVRRPGGLPFADGRTAVDFNQCKLAVFTPDGSVFENVTAGPNNIWGLVTSRDGETFLQEANDMGYPVVPYAPGILVRTGSKDRLRPYQPLIPPTLEPAQMGGTGLSGLALAEDRDTPFATYGSDLRDPAAALRAAKVFFLANPITNRLNAVRAIPEAGRYRYEKLPDFLVSADKWFRPVAIHFGPDGALYIVDWYNRIISHNEVPRTHPDRDKSRGRIWRIRHRDQPRVTPPDLTKLADRALLAHLGGPNALVSRLAWLELVDRRAVALAPDLAALAADTAVALDRRLAALWALESLAPVPAALLRQLAAAPAPALRREAVRLAASALPAPDFAALAAPLVADPEPSVRAALGDALRRVPAPDAAVLLLAARLGGPALPDAPVWPKYERDFERYLARWALELHPAPTAALLASPAGRALPLENRLLATLALGGRDAAVGLATLAPELSRPLDEEEIRTLAAHFTEPAVRSALLQALARPASRPGVLRALLALRTGLDPAPLADALAGAARALLAASAPADVALGAQVAGAFKLSALVPELSAFLTRDAVQLSTLSPQLSTPHPALAALRALRENSAGPLDVIETLIRDAVAPVVRDEALAALAASRDPAAPARLVRLLPGLPVAPRGAALDRLAATPAGAAALVAGLNAGTVAKSDLGLGTVDKLRTVLPADPVLAALWQELGGSSRRALRLDGAAGDFSATQLTLAGPFTLEAWVKLDPEISNLDALAGAPGRLSVNFHAGQLRVWLGNPLGDVVVAKRKVAPHAWTHCAVTRDAEGRFSLYLNGELDAVGTKLDPAAIPGVDLGRTQPKSGGTAGWLAEFRVWQVARNATQIRESFDRSFVANARNAGLAHVFAGDAWGPLQGRARVGVTDDVPALLTPAEAAVQQAKFARFRTLANARGNPDQGKLLFTGLCLTCHQHRGQGGQIAPALDGVGNSGTDALLRHILTPSAAMESAYRTYRIVARDGTVHEGFLADDTPAAAVLRTPGAEDRRFPRAEIKSSAYLSRSLMPEGLLDALSSDQVTDLFSYLKALR
ncbi:MAG: hypothetical protein B9S34_08665 [Opitutia bacterium Tous-C1TDCM]|nr:MAG: hypothetical protein B9S34_08665 [Opitutae bacterium Tous-C1TDCM]